MNLKNLAMRGIIILHSVGLFNMFQDNPHLIKVHEILEDDGRYYIISELMHGGELYDRILKMKKFTEKDVANIGPHIHTLEAAIKDAVNAKLENPKLTILLKNANSILKIRKSLLKAYWNDVENECSSS